MSSRSLEFLLRIKANPKDGSISFIQMENAARKAGAAAEQAGRRAGAGLKKAKNAAAPVNKAMQRMSNQMGMAAVVSGKATRQIVSDYGRQAKAVTSGRVVMDASLGYYPRLEKASKKASDTAVSGLEKWAKWLAYLGTLYVTTRIFSTLENLTKAAEEFRVEATRVQNLQAPIKKVGAALASLDPVYGKQTQLMQNYFRIHSGGITKVNEALAETRDAARTAFGDQANLIDTTKAGIKMWNIYGSELRSTTQSFEILSETARYGDTDLQAISESIAEILPIAKGVGIGIHDLAGVFSLLTRVSKDTSVAATNLASLMRSFTNDTKEAQEAAGELGILWDANTVKTMGFANYLTYLHDALENSNMSEGRKIELLRAMTGRVEAMNALLALMGDQYNNIGEAIDSVSDSYGVITEKFVNMEEQIGVHERWKNAWENIQVELGEGFLPVMESLMKALYDMRGILPTLIKLTLSFVAALLGGLAIQKVAELFTALTANAVASAKAVNMLKFALKTLVAGTVLFAILEIAGALAQAHREANEFADKIKKVLGEQEKEVATVKLQIAEWAELRDKKQLTGRESERLAELTQALGKRFADVRDVISDTSIETDTLRQKMIALNAVDMGGFAGKQEQKARYELELLRQQQEEARKLVNEGMRKYQSPMSAMVSSWFAGGPKKAKLEKYVDAWFDLPVIARKIEAAEKALKIARQVRMKWEQEFSDNNVPLPRWDVQSGLTELASDIEIAQKAFINLLKKNEITPVVARNFKELFSELEAELLKNKDKIPQAFFNATQSAFKNYYGLIDKVLKENNNELLKAQKKRRELVEQALAEGMNDAAKINARYSKLENQIRGAGYSPAEESRKLAQADSLRTKELLKLVSAKELLFVKDGEIIKRQDMLQQARDEAIQQYGTLEMKIADLTAEYEAKKITLKAAAKDEYEAAILTAGLTKAFNQQIEALKRGKLDEWVESYGDLETRIVAINDKYRLERNEMKQNEVLKQDAWLLNILLAGSCIKEIEAIEKLTGKTSDNNDELERMERILRGVTELSGRFFDVLSQLTGLDFSGIAQGISFTAEGLSSLNSIQKNNLTGAEAGVAKANAYLAFAQGAVSIYNATLGQVLDSSRWDRSWVRTFAQSVGAELSQELLNSIYTRVDDLRKAGYDKFQARKIGTMEYIPQIIEESGGRINEAQLREYTELIRFAVHELGSTPAAWQKAMPSILAVMQQVDKGWVNWNDELASFTSELIKTGSITDDILDIAVRFGSDDHLRAWLSEVAIGMAEGTVSAETFTRTLEALANEAQARGLDLTGQMIQVFDSMQVNMSSSTQYMDMLYQFLKAANTMDADISSRFAEISEAVMTTDRSGGAFPAFIKALLELIKAGSSLGVDMSQQMGLFSESLNEALANNQIGIADFLDTLISMQSLAETWGYDMEKIFTDSMAAITESLKSGAVNVNDYFKQLLDSADALKPEWFMSMAFSGVQEGLSSGSLGFDVLKQLWEYFESNPALTDNIGGLMTNIVDGMMAGLSAGNLPLTTFSQILDLLIEKADLAGLSLADTFNNIAKSIRDAAESGAGDMAYLGQSLSLLINKANEAEISLKGSWIASSKALAAYAASGQANIQTVQNSIIGLFRNMALAGQYPTAAIDNLIKAADAVGLKWRDLRPYLLDMLREQRQLVRSIAKEIAEIPAKIRSAQNNVWSLWLQILDIHKEINATKADILERFQSGEATITKNGQTQTLDEEAFQAIYDQLMALHAKGVITPQDFQALMEGLDAQTRALFTQLVTQLNNEAILQDQYKLAQKEVKILERQEEKLKDRYQKEQARLRNMERAINKIKNADLGQKLHQTNYYLQKIYAVLQKQNNSPQVAVEMPIAPSMQQSLGSGIQLPLAAGPNLNPVAPAKGSNSGSVEHSRPMNLYLDGKPVATGKFVTKADLPNLVVDALMQSSKKLPASAVDQND